MKKLILALIVLTATSLSAQEFYLYDVDHSSFPEIKAKYFAFDKEGQFVSDIIKDSLIITKKNTDKMFYEISNLVLPAKQYNVYFFCDISNPLKDNLNLVKSALKKFVDNEIAEYCKLSVLNFKDSAYTVIPLSNSKGLNKSEFDKLTLSNTYNTYDYLSGFDDKLANDDQTIIVYIYDGDRKTSKLQQELKEKLSDRNIKIYGISIGKNNNPIVEIFDRPDIVSCEETTTSLYLYMNAAILEGMNINTPAIKWTYNSLCDLEETYTFNYLPINKQEIIKVKNKDVESPIIITNNSVDFGRISKGNNKSFDIELICKETVNITNIECSNPKFKIYPNKFLFKKDERKKIRVEFAKTDDNNFDWGVISFTSNVCHMPKIYTRARLLIDEQSNNIDLKINLPANKTYKLNKTDTLEIEGALPSDKLVLYYSKDGKSWTRLETKQFENKLLWNGIPGEANASVVLKVELLENSDAEDHKRIFGVNNSFWRTPTIEYSPFKKVFLNYDETMITFIDSASGLYYGKINRTTPEDILRCSFTKDGKKLLVSHKSNYILVYNMENYEQIAQINTLTDNYTDFTISENYFATSENDSILEIYDANSLQIVKTFNISNVRNYCQFSPDSKLFAISNKLDSTLKIYNVLDWSLYRSYKLDSTFFGDLDFSPNSKVIRYTKYKNNGNKVDVIQEAVNLVDNMTYFISQHQTNNFYNIFSHEFTENNEEVFDWYYEYDSYDDPNSRRCRRYNFITGKYSETTKDGKFRRIDSYKIMDNDRIYIRYNFLGSIYNYKTQTIEQTYLYNSAHNFRFFPNSHILYNYFELDSIVIADLNLRIKEVVDPGFDYFVFFEGNDSEFYVECFDRDDNSKVILLKYDAKTYKVLDTILDPIYRNSMGISIDKKILYVRTNNGFKSINLETKQEIAEIEISDYRILYRISKSKKYFAVSTNDVNHLQSITVYRLPGFEKIYELPRLGESYEDINITEDDKLVALTGSGKILLVDIYSGNIDTLYNFKTLNSNSSISYDGSTFVLVNNNILKVVRLKDNKIEEVFSMSHQYDKIEQSLSYDNRYLACKGFYFDKNYIEVTERYGAFSVVDLDQKRSGNYVSDKIDVKRPVVAINDITLPALKNDIQSDTTISAYFDVKGADELNIETIKTSNSKYDKFLQMNGIQSKVLSGDSQSPLLLRIKPNELINKTIIDTLYIDYGFGLEYALIKAPILTAAGDSIEYAEEIDFGDLKLGNYKGKALNVLVNKSNKDLKIKNINVVN